MKAWVKENKKILFVVLGVLVCIGCIFFINHLKTSAGLTGAEAPGNYLFNKYPIENYMLDSYVDTSGNWIPWNWGKAINDGAYSFLTFMVGCLYVGIFKFFHVVGYLVQAVYSTDVVNLLMDTVVTFVQNVSGFNGELQADGLFPQLLSVVVVLTGVYYGFQAIKKETGKTINGVMTFLLLIIVSLGFFWKADYFVGKANEIAVGVQSVVVRAGTNALGMDGDPAAAMREGFFDVTVYQPYLLLQYNDNTVSAERANELLSLESGSEAREALVKAEVENGNKMMNGLFGLQLRLSNMIPLVLSSAVLAVVILAIVCLNIYHQFAFLLYVCFSPFALIISLIPGKSQVAVRLGSKIFYELCMRTALAMLLCLMYGFSSAVFTITGLEGYIVGAVLQAILYIGIFLFRNKIYEFFITNNPVKKGGGFRSMVGTAFLANRAYRMFWGKGMKPVSPAGGGKSNPLGGGFNPAPSGGGYRRPVPGIGVNKGMPQKNNPSNDPDGGSAYATRDKNGYTDTGNAGAKPKGRNQPANAGTTQRKGKPGTNRSGSNTAGNTRYYAGRAKGAANAETARPKRGGYRYGGASGGTFGREDVKNYSVNALKYRVARKENVPRMRKVQWNKQAYETQQAQLRKRKMGEGEHNRKGNYTVRNKTGNSQYQRTVGHGTVGSSENRESLKNSDNSTENRPYRKKVATNTPNSQTRRNVGTGTERKRSTKSTGNRPESNQQQKASAGSNQYRGYNANTGYVVRDKKNLGKQNTAETRDSEKE